MEKFGNFKNHLVASGKAEGTVKQRMLALDHLGRVYPALLEVTTGDLEQYLADRSESHAEETRKAMLSSFRLFYRWAFRQGLIAEDPAAELLAIRIPTKVPRLAPDDVIQRATIAATLEQRTMILLGRLACLRLSELTKLQLRHREGDALRILGKGGKERLVYINDDLMQVLLDRERELGSVTYYFPGRFGGHMHPQSVNKIITRVTGWNPHSLRHAGATAAYRATKDLRGVQAMLGHSSMATTQRYLRIDEESQRAVAAGTAFTRPVVSRHFPRMAREQVVDEAA